MDIVSNLFFSLPAFTGLSEKNDEAMSLALEGIREGGGEAAIADAHEAAMSRSVLPRNFEAVLVAVGSHGDALGAAELRN
jgi:hypothetical protein